MDFWPSTYVGLLTDLSTQELVAFENQNLGDTNLADCTDSYTAEIPDSFLVMDRRVPGGRRRGSLLTPNVTMSTFQGCSNKRYLNYLLHNKPE